MATQQEQRYTTHEVRSGAIPLGTHVAHYIYNASGGAYAGTGPGYAVETGILGRTSDQVSDSHITLNGRKVIAGANDYWIVTDERMNEVA
jgi:hypothetical protein